MGAVTAAGALAAAVVDVSGLAAAVVPVVAVLLVAAGVVSGAEALYVMLPASTPPLSILSIVYVTAAARWPVLLTVSLLVQTSEIPSKRPATSAISQTAAPENLPVSVITMRFAAILPEREPCVRVSLPISKWSTTVQTTRSVATELGMYHSRAQPGYISTDGSPLHTDMCIAAAQ
jgi:hypothetical protein